MPGSSRQRNYVKKLVYASLFAALTCVGAWVTIPLPFVPITLQTLFVILSGGVLGAYFGALSMIVYVLLGLAGLPVFSKGQSGLGVLFGPTGGYLIGFVLCAIVVGYLAERRKSPGYLWYCSIMALGTIVLYSAGVAGLILITHMNPVNAVLIGVVPFIPGDIVKILVAAWIAKKVRDEKMLQV